MRVYKSKEKPPIYERLVKAFGINWNRGVIIAYGDTIYCKRKLTQAKIVHEKTHLKQQAGMGVEAWWDKYIEDPQFRLLQEIEAYTNEIEWIKDNIYNMHERKALVDKIVLDLSSSMYGSIVTQEEAYNLLQTQDESKANGK